MKYRVFSCRSSTNLFIQCEIDKGLRYRLLEPARQYAREKLRDCGEENRAARSYVVALLALAADFDSRLELIPDHVWDEFIARERENFHAAFEWALGSNGDLALGQRLAGSMSAIWTGFQSGEVQKWVSAALKSCSDTTSPRVRAALEISAARVAIHFERNAEARVKAGRKALAAQLADDHRAVGIAQYYLGLALGSMGRYDEADSILRAAREAARSVGAQNDYNVATRALAVARSGVGDLHEARKLVSEALLHREASGSGRGAADARVELAEIEFASGSAEEALRLNEEAAEFFRSHSHLRRLPITLCNSSAYLIALERYREAWEHAHEALRRSRAVGNVDSVLWAMQHLAAIAVFGSNQSGSGTALERAAKILGFVDESTTQRAKYRPFTERQEYEKMFSALRVAFGEGELKKHMAIGKAWPEDQAIAEALEITV